MWCTILENIWALLLITEVWYVCCETSINLRPMSGMLIPFQNQSLGTIKAFRGIQYGLLGRFREPLILNKEWNHSRSFMASSSMVVCYQQFRHLRSMSMTLSFYVLSRLRRIEPYLLKQTEGCLKINVYVPMKGKLERTLNTMRECD